MLAPNFRRKDCCNNALSFIFSHSIIHLTKFIELVDTDECVLRIKSKF